MYIIAWIDGGNYFWEIVSGEDAMQVRCSDLGNQFGHNSVVCGDII